MLKKVKIFLNQMNIAFSKAFFGQQSLASNVLKDRLFAIFSREIDGKEFSIISGSITPSDVPEFNPTYSMMRGNDAGRYSRSYKLDSIPSVINEIIRRHKAEITRYLGKDFLCEPPTFWRNMNFPGEMESYDVYSNIWHQDSHDGDRLLKIFVLPMDVTMIDGPFTYLDRVSTLKHWIYLMDRWDFAKITQVPSFAEEKYAIGKRGDYLIIDTSKCMHRASNPIDYRDILQITLYPSWRKGGDRYVYQ